MTTELHTIITKGYAKKTSAQAAAKIIKSYGLKYEIVKPLGRYYWRINLID